MLSDYISLPRSVHILCLGTFINRAGTFIVPFLTLYLDKKLGFGERFATRAMGLFGLGSIIAALLGGHLADRIGRKRVMLIGLVGGASVLLLLSNARHPVFVLVLVGMFSLLGDLYRPAAMAMIGDLVEPVRRPHAFGLLYVSINLGVAIGPAVGGFLAAKSYKLLFYGDAASSLVYAVIILLAIRETLNHVSSSELDAAVRPLSTAQAARHILTDRVFMTFCAATLLVAIVYMQSFSTLPLVMQGMGVDEKRYGAVIALNGLMIGLFQLPLTSFLARFDRARVIVLSAIVTGLGFSATMFASVAWHFAAVVVIWTIGEMMQAGYLSTIVTDLAPPALRGRYMGMLGVCFAGSMMLGAPLGGEVLSRFGPRVLWTGSLAVALIGAGLYASVRKKIRRSP